MKKANTDKGFISFSTPEPMNNIIYVNKVHSDYTTEVIGKIQPKFNSEDDTIYYIATDLKGDELFPPTTDFTEIETIFINYSKAQSEKSFTEAMTEEADRSANRKVSLKHIRNFKFKDFGFNKSY